MLISTSPAQPLASKHPTPPLFTGVAIETATRKARAKDVKKVNCILMIKGDVALFLN